MFAVVHMCWSKCVWGNSCSKRIFAENCKPTISYGLQIFQKAKIGGGRERELSVHVWDEHDVVFIWCGWS